MQGAAATIPQNPAPAIVAPVETPEAFDEMRASCHQDATNLVVVLTVRGSGQPYGGWGDVTSGNSLNGAYFEALSTALRDKGYRVYGMEARYPALSVDALKDGQVQDFILSAVAYRRAIAAQIRNMAVQCPSARIVIAAYSQGGIALRSAVALLEPQYLVRVENIDLIADASAWAEGDDGMPRGRTTRSYVWRRSTQGIWWVAVKLRNGRDPVSLAARKLYGLDGISGVQDAPVYPAWLRPRIDQYCHDGDLVCDSGAFTRALAGAASLSLLSWDSGAVKAQWGLGTSLHGAYPLRYIALDTADAFGAPPEPAPYEVASYRWSLVQWGGDTANPRTSWLVAPDLTRMWIPDAATYHCLMRLGAGPAVLPAATLDRLPDRHGVWARCGDDTLPIGPVDAPVPLVPPGRAPIVTPIATPAAAPPPPAAVAAAAALPGPSAGPPQPVATPSTPTRAAASARWVRGRLVVTWSPLGNARGYRVTVTQGRRVARTITTGATATVTLRLRRLAAAGTVVIQTVAARPQVIARIRLPRVPR